MALKIRLRRMGRRNAPTYRIVVAESSMPRDGRIIASIGHYNPRTDPLTLSVDRVQALHWIDKGARPTETVKALLKRAGVFRPEAESPVAEAVAAVSEAARTVTKKTAKAASAAGAAVQEAAETAREAVADVVEAVAERVAGDDAVAAASEAAGTVAEKATKTAKAAGAAAREAAETVSEAAADVVEAVAERVGGDEIAAPDAPAGGAAEDTAKE
jgi:small subunit ribosomal protein S16